MKFRYPTDPEEAHEYVQEFAREFAGLVRRFFPTEYTQADPGLLAECQDMTSLYAAYVWGEEHTPNQSAAEALRKVRAAVRGLVKAEVADSWKGGGDPEDIPLIEERLKHAKQKLDAALMMYVSAPRLPKELK